MGNEDIVNIYNKGKKRFYLSKLIIALFLSTIGLGIRVIWEYLIDILIEDINGIRREDINVLEYLLSIFIIISLMEIIVASKQWKKIQSQFHKLQKEKNI